jgi:hypothetical protein
MLLICDNNKLIFQTSEKSNCTAIAKIFFHTLGLLEEALQYHIWIHKYEQEIYIPNHLPIGSKNYSSYLKLNFVRNPFTRAVSSFLHCMKAAYNNPTLWKKQFHNLSFEEFLIFFQNGDLQNEYAINHANPQYNPNYYNDFQTIKIENLETEIQNINKKYQKNFRMDFTSHHFHNNYVNNKSEHSFCGNIKYFDIKKLMHLSNLPPYHFFYNERTKQLVTSIYKDDLENFHYSFEEAFPGI